MFFPPQCYPNPKLQCAIIFAATPVWLGTYLQNQVTSLNLSLGVAHLYVGAFALDVFVKNSLNRAIIQYNDPTSAQANTECNFVGSSIGMPCIKRIPLPAWSTTCLDLYTGDYDAPYSCDMPIWSLMRLARKDLVKIAPRVDYLLAQSDFTPADTHFFFQQFGAQADQSFPQDHKSVACAWLKEPVHKMRWQNWIAPPPACTIAIDTFSTCSPCDESTAHMTISYEWREPKACVGGAPLPDKENVACTLVSTPRSTQTAFFALAVVLETFLSIMVAMRIVAGVHTAETTTTTMSRIRMHTPMLQLLGSSFYALHLGLFVLILLPLIQFFINLSEVMCWLRYTIVLVGLSLTGQSLLIMAIEARNAVDKLLGNGSLSTIRGGMIMILVIQIISIISVASSAKYILLTIQSVASSNGGAIIQRGYCSIPSTWIAVTQLSGIVLWFVGGFILIFGLLFRVHFNELFGMLINIKGKASSRRVITRVQALQVNSIAASFFLLMFLTLLLITSLYNIGIATDFMQLFTLVGSVAIWSTLYLPSFWRARQLMTKSSKCIADDSAKSKSINASMDLMIPQHDAEGLFSMSLASVLSDPLLILHFRRFTEQRFDGEAIHFLLACQVFYRSLHTSTLNLTQLTEALENIAEEFIVIGAKQQVNISQDLRDATLTSIQDFRLTAVTMARERLKPASIVLKASARACLHGAVTEVYRLVQFNSYPRFLASTSIMAHSQKLFSWAEGFDEVDQEEQIALLAKLKNQHNVARRTSSQHSQASRTSDDDAGNQGRIKQEARLLVNDDMETPAAPPSIQCKFSQRQESVISMDKASSARSPTSIVHTAPTTSLPGQIIHGRQM